MNSDVSKDAMEETRAIDKRYGLAKKETDDRLGNARVQARNWRMATFFSLFLVLFSVVGLIYLGSLPKLTPHIVEIDKLGQSAYMGPAGQSWKDYTPSDASKRFHLRRFVVDTRSLPSDPVVVRKQWEDAYKLVTRNASNVLSEFAKSTDPFGRMKDERVEVDIHAMVPISPDSWQIDWAETTWGKRGDMKGRVEWTGIFNMTFRQPPDEKSLLDNPIGLYIDSFNWSQIN